MTSSFPPQIKQSPRRERRFSGRSLFTVSFSTVDIIYIKKYPVHITKKNKNPKNSNKVKAFKNQIALVCQISGPLHSPVKSTPTQHYSIIVWLWDDSEWISSAEQNRSRGWKHIKRQTSECVSDVYYRGTFDCVGVCLSSRRPRPSNTHERRCFLLSVRKQNTSLCFPDRVSEHLDVSFWDDATSAGDFPYEPFLIHLLQGGHHVPNLHVYTDKNK